MPRLNVPILNDVMGHPVLGRERKRGIEIGFAKGLEKGSAAALQEGELLLSRLISQRFGPVTAHVRKRIAALPPARLEKVGLRLLGACSSTNFFAEASRKPTCDRRQSRIFPLPWRRYGHTRHP